MAVLLYNLGKFLSQYKEKKFSILKIIKENYG